MKVTNKQYATALFELVQDKKDKDLELVLSNFIKLLIERNDHFKINRIILEFETLWHKQHSIVKLEVESARKLSEELLDDLVKKIKELTKSSEIILSQAINKDLIAGAVLKYNDTILDLSLRTRLRKLKESLSV